MDRPIIVDLQDGPCDICEDFQNIPQLCKTCRVEALPEVGGGKGYQSPKPHHYHLRKVEGIAGKVCVFSEACRECYRTLFRAAYPETPLPACVE